MSDLIETPTHYTAGKVQTCVKQEMIAELLEKHLSAYEISNLCTAIKYLERMGLKDDISKDAMKCADYLYKFKTGEFLNEVQ